MKLLAYKIDGKIVNKEIFNWNLSDLEGNKPWLVSNVDVYGYADITTIENWDTYAPYVNKDFLFIRQCIKDLVDYSFIDKNGDTWRYSENMNFGDGVIASRYFLVSKSIRDQFISDSEQEFYWKILVDKSQESRKKRWESAKTYISFKLSPQNSSDLALSTSDLCNNYINYNIVSKTKDGVSGLFDYLRGIEDYSTNGYPSKSYWSQQDQDRLLDILENGNY